MARASPRPILSTNLSLCDSDRLRLLARFARETFSHPWVILFGLAGACEAPAGAACARKGCRFAPEGLEVLTQGAAQHLFSAAAQTHARSEVLFVNAVPFLVDRQLQSFRQAVAETLHVEVCVDMSRSRLLLGPACYMQWPQLA